MGTIKITYPLSFNFFPKEDITTYELAMCMKIYVGPTLIYPNDKILEESYFRHFEVIDNNKY